MLSRYIYGVARSPFVPLLEEKGDACLGALITHIARPGGVHRAGAGAALAAADDPVEARTADATDHHAQFVTGEWERGSEIVFCFPFHAARQINRPERRLVGDESDRRRRLQQERNALVGGRLVPAGNAE